jgi:hypothetical protein
MTEVYLIPTNLDLQYLITFIGTEGTVINPVKDADGNYIISQEIWDSYEFTESRATLEGEGYVFILIDYNPIIYPPGPLKDEIGSE